MAWFLLATVAAMYLAYHSADDAPSYIDSGRFNAFFILANMPLIIGWGIWWKAPGLLVRVDKFFTESRVEEKSRDRLRRMLEDGLHILNRPVHTEVEFNNWKTDDKNWGSAVERELKTVFNESLAESFQSLDGLREFEIASSFNSEHNSLKLALNKRLNNLTKILE